MLQTCGKTITQIPDYIQIVGIILGMCTLGYLGDKIGRKWGSVFTASIMLVGAILLTATDAPTDRGFVIFYIISQVCLHHSSSPLQLSLAKLVPCITKPALPWRMYLALDTNVQPCIAPVSAPLITSAGAITKTVGVTATFLLPAQQSLFLQSLGFFRQHV